MFDNNKIFGKACEIYGSIFTLFQLTDVEKNEKNIKLLICYIENLHELRMNKSKN
mgnify:CR=1 FL=1